MASVWIYLATGPVVARAAHPLITEDTGTQGAGNSQIEFTYDALRDNEDGVRLAADWFSAVYSYGWRDDLDVIVSLPYGRVRIEEDGETTQASGVGDMGLDLKWRFYEREALSFALKPGTTFETGDEDEALGSGRQRASVFFVGTLDPKPWALHLHLGYLWNADVHGERENLWHASIGGWWWLTEQWRIVGDVGTFRNTDPESGRNPAFAILGFIYSPREDLDFDFGVRSALTSTEADYSLLAGVTIQF
jgi:hypothetical protein